MSTVTPHGLRKAQCPSLYVDARFPDGACCCLTPAQARELDARLAAKSASMGGHATSAPGIDWDGPITPIMSSRGEA